MDGPGFLPPEISPTPAAASPVAQCPATGPAGLRVLYLTHRLPYPPSGGARVRAFHSLRHLAARNSVTVAAPVRDADEAVAAEALAGLGHRVLTAPLGRGRALTQAAWRAGTARPASTGYFHAPGLVRQVRALLRREAVDLIVVHCSAVGDYVADIAGIAKVLDFVDMDSCKWRDYSRVTGPPHRLVHAWEARTLRRAEARLARSFDLSLVATRAEAESLAEIAGPVPHAVVRNGVDLDYFHPGGGAPEPERLCFLGRMDYFPNVQAMVDFCREVLPRVQAVRPGARLSIVGAAPTPAVRALARLPGVEVTGSVADVRPHVWRSAVSVAPLKLARGTQNKVLEAMALGVPVVASGLAARGIEATPGTHLLRADGPAETAAAILDLLDDGAARARMARAARAHLKIRYAWSSALADLDTALLRVLSG